MNEKDLKVIKKLIDILNKENLTELEYQTKNVKIKLAKSTITKLSNIDNVIYPEPNKKEVLKKDQQTLKENIFEVKAPLVGTFYRAPAPNAKPFVEVGQKIKKGDVLCIIEAMKLMNEIESEVDGVVKEILIENGKPVQYGQILFLIEKL